MSQDNDMPDKLPDVIYAHRSVPDDPTWGAWLSHDECCEKYFSESHIQQLEAKHKQEMDSALAKQRVACAMAYKEQCGTPFRGHVMKAILNAILEEGGS